MDRPSSGIHLIGDSRSNAIFTSMEAKFLKNLVLTPIFQKVVFFLFCFVFFNQKQKVNYSYPTASCLFLSIGIIQVAAKPKSLERGQFCLHFL